MRREGTLASTAIAGALAAMWLAAVSIVGCGGARVRAIDGHEMRFEGEREQARLWVDGTEVVVEYDRVAGAYRAPGCDFGPAATLESLAEQVATTSPGSCRTAGDTAPR